MLFRSAPVVTVSPVGVANSLSQLVNGGADFGPDTLLNNVGPGLTQTSGIAEALQAASTLTGATVYLIPNGIFSVAATIQVPSNIRLLSGMIGGEAYGPVNTPPVSYVNYTPATGDCFLFSLRVAGIVLEGIAVQGASSPPGSNTLAPPTSGSDPINYPQGAMLRRSGCRNVRFLNCYAYNSKGPALATDGLVLDTEDNSVYSCYFEGVPGVRIGYPPSYFSSAGSELNKSNNCLWIDVTVEAQDGTTAVDWIEGGGHYWLNPYCRNGPTTVFNVGGNAQFVGGEFAQKGGASTPTIFKVTGGQVVWSDSTWTLGNITVQGSSTSMTLRNIHANSSPGTVTVNHNGQLIIDRSCDLSRLAASSIVVNNTGGAGSINYDPANPNLNTHGSQFSVGTGGILNPLGADFATPALPGGFGTGNSTPNSTSTRILVSQAGGKGVQIVTRSGTRSPTDPTAFILLPGDSVYWASGTGNALPTAWTWTPLD